MIVAVIFGYQTID